jgi:hypothetical protein
MNKAMAVTVLGLVSTFLGQSTACQDPGDSGAMRVPIEVRREVRMDVLSSELEIGKTARGTLRLRNASQHSITRVRLIVDYLDAKDERLLSIPFHAGLDSAGHENWIVPTFLHNLWEDPVTAQQDFVINGTALLTINERPVRARLSLIEIRYADTDDHILTELGWKSEPILATTPKSSGIGLNGVVLPASILLAVRVSAEGRVVEVASSDLTTLAPDVLKSVKSELSRWTFFPSRVDGQRTASRVQLMVRFRGDSECLGIPFAVAGKDVEGGSFAVVDFLVGDGALRQVCYGGYPARGPFQAYASKKVLIP